MTVYSIQGQEWVPCMAVRCLHLAADPHHDLTENAGRSYHPGGNFNAEFRDDAREAFGVDGG
jgi:hypothetical protein